MILLLHLLIVYRGSAGTEFLLVPCVVCKIREKRFGQRNENKNRQKDLHVTKRFIPFQKENTIAKAQWGILVNQAVQIIGDDLSE